MASKLRIERDGKPDQYLDVRAAAGQSADGIRQADRDAEIAREKATPRITHPVLSFGQRLCPRCSGNGGSVRDACPRCAGAGVVV